MGDHFGTMRHISVTIDGTSPKFFMVDGPSDALQTHEVSGQNSLGGRAGGQKSQKSHEILSNRGPRRSVSEDGAEGRHVTIEPRNKRSQSHEMNSQLGPTT